MPVSKKLLDVNVIDKVRFVIPKSVVFSNPIILNGFQGVGLVGTLSAQFLSQKLDFELIGYVDSEGIPPLALLVNGEVRNPVKIFSNKKRDIIIIESELSIPRKIIYELSDEITKWARVIKAREIVCMEGIAVTDEERDYEVFGMSTSKEVMKKLTLNGVKKLDNGIVIGMSAALLLRSKELGIPATCLMVESRSNFPDGLAAAEVLKVMGKVYGFSINVDELKSQAHAFERKIEKIISHAEQLKNIEGSGAPSKRSIYG